MHGAVSCKNDCCGRLGFVLSIELDVHVTTAEISNTYIYIDLLTGCGANMSRARLFPHERGDWVQQDNFGPA